MILLDTHVWLWYLSEDPRLPRSLGIFIDEHDGGRFLSALSVYEFGVLTRKGRFRIVGPNDGWLRDARRKVPVAEAPVTDEIAAVAATLDIPTNDPIDRLIAATAQVEHLELLSIDRALQDIPGVVTRSR